MKKSIKHIPTIALGLALAITLTYCSPKTTKTAVSATPKLSLKPNEMDAQKAQARWANMDLATLQDGYNTFVAKCQMCHALKKPYNFTEAQLQKIVPEMAKKANIDENTDTYKHLLEYMIAKSYAKDKTMPAKAQ